MKILFAKKAYELPESWAEVGREKIPALVELAYLMPDIGATHLEVVRVVLGIKKRIWNQLLGVHFSDKMTEDVREANASNINYLVRQCSWIWDEPMTEMPFEFFAHQGEKYYLSKSTAELPFGVMSYGELANAYINLQGFVKKLRDDDFYLDNLVATLCRRRQRVDSDYTGLTERGWMASGEGNWNGDLRVSYNEYLCAEMAGKFANLGYDKKLAVLMYFAGNLKRFMDSYKGTFGRGDGDGEEYIGQGFLKNQHLLAEKGVFGTLAQTKTANCHEVLMYLEEYGADMEKKMEAQRQSMGGG